MSTGYASASTIDNRQEDSSDFPSDIYPKGMPGPGQRVSIYPSNTVRDLFYANDGRISKDQMTNAIGRLTSTLPFTAGWDITNAWTSLVDEGYVQSEGAFWVWPMAVPVFD